MKIIVDADACPVKQEIAQTANTFHVPVWMIASYDHLLPELEGVRIIQVDRSDQSADMYIANQLRSGDILVTQDFGLATIGLAKDAIVLSNRGQRYTDRTIDFLLDRRAQQAKQRRSGARSKGPKRLTDSDRARFLQTLTENIIRLQENNEI